MNSILILDEKLIDTNDRTKLIEEIAKESVKWLEDPFKNLTTKDVQRDLNISHYKTLQIFRSKDFPAITIGKTWTVMLLPYLIWKLERKD